MSQLNVFSRLPKFTGVDGGPHFHTWLKNFERCCTIAEKKDDLVQGQLLMLSVEGRVLAVLEQVEEEKGSQLKYSDLKQSLTMVFDSPADQEARMTEFESRVQHLDETEEEYMLALIKLFKAANHDVKPEDINRAVKQKFLNSISADLCHNVFIFCNNPLDDTVGHQDLLKASRDARVHLTATKQLVTPASDDPIFHTASRPTCRPTQVSSNATVNALTDNSTLNAVLSLTKKFDEQVRLNEQRFKEQEDKINLLSNSSQQFSRGRGRWPMSRRSFRGRTYAAPQQEPGWATQPNSYPSEIRCHYCNELNHFKQDCVLFKRHNQQQDAMWNFPQQGNLSGRR